MELKDLNTKFLGQKFNCFDTILSTQTFIKDLEKEGKLSEGEIIFAERQTGGIGTHDRKWYTGKGKNLAFSFALFPNYNIKKLDKLTIIIAESLVQAVKELYMITLDIKEPNDVIFKGKKMGGIITESVTEGEIIKKVFVGIGFNVNQEEFPGNLVEIATSLKIEFKAEFSREDILIRFLELFEERYRQIK